LEFYLNIVGAVNDFFTAVCKKKKPRTSTIQIFKATKEGKFLGQNDYSHMVQAVFKCEGGMCWAEKNRFGGNEGVKIRF
jgi:predicted ATP-dependent serine protease